MSNPMLKEIKRTIIGKEHERQRHEKHFNSKEDYESQRESDLNENQLQNNTKFHNPERKNKIFYYSDTSTQYTKSYPQEKHFLHYDKSCDIINV